MCNPLSIRHVSAHNQRDLLFTKLLDGDLEGVGLAFEVDKYWGVHAAKEEHQHHVACTVSPPSALSLYLFPSCAGRCVTRSWKDGPDLQGAGAQDARLFVLCHVRRGGSLAVGDLLVLVRLLPPAPAVRRRAGIARGHHVVGAAHAVDRIVVLAVPVGSRGVFVPVTPVQLGFVVLLLAVDIIKGRLVSAFREEMSAENPRRLRAWEQGGQRKEGSAGQDEETRRNETVPTWGRRARSRRRPT